MTRAWTAEAYRTRLLAAIEHERWDEVDRVRVAVKRRLLEMVARCAGEQEIAAARDLLTYGFDKLRLSKKVRIEQGALMSASRMLADAETAGLAFELAPAPVETARDTAERILQVLSSGNQMPRTTGELASEIGRSVETVSRSLSKLRAEGKILSRRNGRNVSHRIVGTRLSDYRNTLDAKVVVAGSVTSSPAKAWLGEPVGFPLDERIKRITEIGELQNRIKLLLSEMHFDTGHHESETVSEAEEVCNPTAPRASNGANSDRKALMLKKHHATPWG